MASVAMPGVQRRGRLITYSRHSQKAVGSFTNERKVSREVRVAKSPSRFQEPVVSPAQITKLQSSSKNADLFDVPSSDDEMPPRKRLSGKVHRLRDEGVPSPTRPRVTQRETQTKSGLSQSMALSQTPKKRKRTHPAGEMIVSHAGVDVSRQISLQVREKKSQKPMDPKCSTPRTASTKLSHSLQGITSSRSTGMPLQAILAKHNRTEITRSINVAPSIPTTPRQPPQVVQSTPSTPPGQTETAASPLTQRKYLSTPRQVQLWSNLLGNGLTFETTNHPETPPSTPPGQTEGAATPSTGRRGLTAERQAQRWNNLHSNTAMAETTGHRETLISTPPGQTESAATPSTLRRCITTPRQAQLWSSLLDNEMTSDTTNHLETLDFGKRIVCSNQSSTGHRKVPRRKLVDILNSQTELFRRDTDGQEAQSDEVEILDEEGIKPRVITQDAGQVERTQHSYHPRAIDLPPLQQQTTVPSGPRITYAGQRSYLDDTNLAFESLLEQPFDLAICPELVRPRHQRHNNRTGLQPDLVEILEEEQSGNRPTQSIHELRAFGDTRWFTDEIDMLLEDLDCGKDASISRKRSALLELCNKLKDSSFKNHFIQNGFEFRVISRCKGESDIIFGTTFATILVMVLDATIEPQSLLQSYNSGIIEILVKMLEHEEDIITISKHRRSNMSRAAQGAVVQYRALAVGLSVWKFSTPHVVSPRIMALQSLELLVRKLREAGSKEIILRDQLLQLLLGIMEQSLRHVMKMANKVTTTAFTELELSLSILETCTIAHECASNVSIWSTKRLRQLAKILDLAFNSVPLEPASIITLALRLCCNLANNSERNANLFVKPSLIRRIIAFVNTGFERVQALAIKSDEPARFDVLLLSLGAMINLAEWSDEVRQVVIQNRDNLLDPLLRSFLGSRDGASVAGSLGASQANVAYGYLAVLLGNLSQNNDIRMLITLKVPKGLDMICEAVEEFIQCHKEADRHEDGNDVWAAFTDRLQLVVERLKSFDD